MPKDNTKAEKLAAEAETLHSDVERLDRDIAERREQQAALQQEYAALRQRRIDLKSEVDGLETQRVDKRKALAIVRRRIDRMPEPEGGPVTVEAKPAIVNTKVRER